MTVLETLANDWEETFPNKRNLYRTSLEKLRETRTMKIKGKNVDDVDLEKVGNLIRQANEKGSFDLRGMFDRLKRSRACKPERKERKQ